MKRTLQIVTSAYRCNVEEQDDPVLWIAQVMKGAGADLDVLLEGNAVNYAARGQDASGLSFGGKAQTRPPRIEDELKRLVSKGVTIHVVEEDCRRAASSAETWSTASGRRCARGWAGSSRRTSRSGGGDRADAAGARCAGGMGGRAMLLRQYYLECLAQASYLVADERSGRAVVVDPRRDVDVYLDEAARLGVRIERVILTHLHADFVAGHLELRERTRCAVHLGRGSARRVPVLTARGGRRDRARLRAARGARDAGPHARGHLARRLRPGPGRPPTPRGAHRGHAVRRRRRAAGPARGRWRERGGDGARPLPVVAPEAARAAGRDPRLSRARRRLAVRPEPRPGDGVDHRCATPREPRAESALRGGVRGDGDGGSAAGARLLRPRRGAQPERAAPARRGPSRRADAAVARRCARAARGGRAAARRARPAGIRRRAPHRQRQHRALREARDLGGDAARSRPPHRARRRAGAREGGRRAPRAGRVPRTTRSRRGQPGRDVPTRAREAHGASRARSSPAASRRTSRRSCSMSARGSSAVESASPGASTCR